jgi:RNA polymerase sigma factor for flagellar operon FliA
MTGPTRTPSPEQIALLSQIIRDVARAKRLPREDAEDFAQTVQLRFLERRYDILGRFEGRSSLRTYLTIVVGRMLLDWRNSRYGKWRPSAAAVHLGPHAVDLERLTSRDGCSTEEATEILRAQEDAPPLPALRRLADQLPSRPRRRMVPEDALFGVEGPRFEDPIEVRERRQAERRTRDALAAALRQLPTDDRRLIHARYIRGQSVQAVSQARRSDSKALYRRYARVLQSLRGTLLAAGVTPDAYGAARPARGPLLSRAGA